MGYKKIIHYGYSQGATAALDRGMDDPKCVAIFAFSPHLDLLSPFTRPAEDIDPIFRSKLNNSLISRVLETNKNIKLFLSVVDIKDGAQVIAVQKTGKPFYALLETHRLGQVNKPADVVNEWLRTEKYNLPANVQLANKNQIESSISAYKISAAVLGGTRPQESDLKCAEQYGTPAAAYWVARGREVIGDYNHAVEMYAKALANRQKLSDHGISEIEILMSFGNTLKLLERYAMALGCYHEALSHDPESDYIKRSIEEIRQFAGSKYFWK